MCFARLLVGSTRCPNLGVGSILSPYIRGFVGPLPKIFSAVIAHPIVCLAYGGQDGTVWQFEIVKGIAACRVGFLVLVLNVVDSNAYDSVAAIPAFDDFVTEPTRDPPFRSDKNHSHTRVLELVVDPAFDRSIPLFLDGLPINGINKAVLDPRWKPHSNFGLGPRARRHVRSES